MQRVPVTLPMTLTEAAAQLRAGQLTSVDLTRELLSRADRLADLGAYVTRFDDAALAAAARADEELAAGRDRGPLHGIPIAVKDIFAMAEGPTTAQSAVLDPAWGDGRDAPVVRRLRDAGAVLTGKSVTMEFAIGMPDPSGGGTLPRNPWDPGRWTGGSSSGAGNGVAAGLFLAGLGSDTGGSIRIPAAYCGVSGIKPTFGRVPKSGCVPLGYSLDHVGPLARSARDCAAVLGAIAGADPTDGDTADRPVPDYLAGLTGSLEGVRIGVERANHLPPFADEALRPRFEAAVDALTALGASVREVTIDGYAEAGTAALVTMGAESLAYHRGDLAGRWDDYWASTRLWVSIGALVSGADYVQAQRVRRRAQQVAAGLFDEVDLIVTPTLGSAAPSYTDITPEFFDPAVSGALLFVSYWDLVGYPALAVPMGFTGDDMPLSLQIVGRPFDEQLVLRAGDAYQTATDWHLRQPPALDAALTGTGAGR